MVSYKNLKLFSFFAFFIFGIGLYIFIALFTTRNFNYGVMENMLTTQSFVKNSVDNFINSKKQFYFQKAQIIFSDESIVKAFEDKDRETFYKKVNVFYQRLKRTDDRLWGLHVIFADNMSFVRIHKPQASDSLIPKGKKPLVDKVHETRKIQTGFEPGRFGYFFRVNVPIFSKDKTYLGMAEFSLNVDSLTSLIKERFGYESALLINNVHNKKFLAHLHKNKKGEVVYKPTSEKIEDIVRGLEHKHSKAFELHTIDNKTYKDFNIKLGENEYLTVFFDVSRIIEQRAQFEDRSYYFLFVILIISLAIWTMLNIYALKLIKFRDNAKEELENLLYKDSLTGLGSYQALQHDVDHQDHMFTSLILINIDNFQNINSVYGFEAGNDILKQFAKYLEEFNKNKSYKLYRTYADEFILYENCQFSTIDKYYDDLIELKSFIDNSKFYIESVNTHIKIDVTFGVSLGQENPISTVDMALRYAKKNKLWYKAYNCTMDFSNTLQDTLQWKEKIKDALREDRVIPVFQPIANRKNEIIKYEVLTRIEEYEGNEVIYIEPSKFLDIAINVRQYSNIINSVLLKTFRIMKKSDKYFSINLSYMDIENNTLIKLIEKYIVKDPSLAKRLVIEILETHEVENYETLIEFVTKFKKLGVKIAIDDFGIGHSNLSHILKINPDYLKIDGIFIKDIHKDKASYAMVKSIVAFCKELDITVIAEFVHSKEVRDVLLELGVDEFQGYYISKPILNIDS